MFLSKIIYFSILLISNYLCSAHTKAWAFFLFLLLSYSWMLNKLECKEVFFALGYKAECSSLIYVMSCHELHNSVSFPWEYLQRVPYLQKWQETKVWEDYASKQCHFLSTFLLKWAICSTGAVSSSTYRLNSKKSAVVSGESSVLDTGICTKMLRKHCNSMRISNYKHRNVLLNRCF